MMLNNDQFDRWVNGTLGRVSGARMDDGLVVTVEFTDGETRRREAVHLGGDQARRRRWVTAA